MRDSVGVLVLGDIGRSPRMQYHALSLANHGLRVDLIGYEGKPPRDELQAHSNITLHYLKPLKIRSRVIKPIAQFLKLMWILLFVIARPRFVLVQNPPSIPTLAVVYLASLLRWFKLVIDWHNLGFSLLAITKGSSKHPMVVIHRIYERLFGRLGSAHLCVTQAMRNFLQSQWGIRNSPMHVLYDRPPPFYRPISLEERHALFSTPQVVELLKPLSAMYEPSRSSNSFTRTPFTEHDPRTDTYSLRKDRPALLVSSTSWSADEDFGILLDALVRLDANIVASRNSGNTGTNALPNVVCIITGDGEMRAFYEQEIAKKQLKACHIFTTYLSHAHYAQLLGAADLGVSLHTSSSGLDLPMKVVDMFGAGLPVCAIGFECLPELVRHGETGLVFSSSSELCEQVTELLRGLSAGNGLLERMRSHVIADEQERGRWDDAWDRIAWPLFRSYLSSVFSETEKKHQ